MSDRITLPPDRYAADLALTRELLRRDARDDILAFARLTFRGEGPYLVGRHHRELASALNDVAAGKCNRLIVSMPPQHGKSRLTSVHFPAWYLGKHPRASLAVCAYNQGLAIYHSHHAREVFASDLYDDVFPGVARRFPGASVKAMYDRIDDWRTLFGGGLTAGGVTTGLTGKTVHAAIIDDPHKDREEANSRRYRERAIMWYDSVLEPRLLKTGGPIILVMTRWHPGDLAGHLLKRQSGEWREVVFRALDDETGESLWPDMIPRDRLEAIRDTIPAHEWEAIYQQRPVVPGGNMLSADRIVWHDDPADFPEDGYMRAWDLASTSKERAGQDPDYTAGVLATVTSSSRSGGGDNGSKWNIPVHDLWIRDVQVFREEAPERDRRIRQTALDDGEKVPILVEAVAGYKDAYTQLKRALKGIRSVRKSELAGDKVAKASGLEAVIEHGRLHVLRGPWSSLLYEQFSEFPAGSHDDLVDAAAIVYEHLTSRKLTRRPGSPSGKRLRSRRAGIDDDGWGG